MAFEVGGCASEDVWSIVGEAEHQVAAAAEGVTGQAGAVAVVLGELGVLVTELAGAGLGDAGLVAAVAGQHRRKPVLRLPPSASPHVPSVAATVWEVPVVWSICVLAISPHTGGGLGVLHRTG